MMYAYMHLQIQIYHLTSEDNNIFRVCTYHFAYLVGQGLPPVHRRLAEMILKGEYVNFTEFPPAKGKVKSLPNLEGNILVIQAADLAQYKKLIPDLATWIQCFTTFMAIITKHQPDRSPELLAYIKLIVRASTK